MLNAKAQSYKRGKYRVPEVAKAAGPQQMGVTGDGSYSTLFGRNWAAILNKKTKQAELYGQTPTGWEQVAIPPIAHPIKECRHLALAFDQSARHVLAYEREGQIFIRQWDALLGEFVYRGPFVGVDPVLINDAEVNYFVPDSDVLLLYLTPDRKSLKMRVQRQLYAIEHHIESYSSPKTLDILAPLGYQWQAEGDALNVRSEMYPVYISEMAASGAVSPPTTWDYIPIVLIQNLNEIAASGAVSPPTTWDYIPIVLIQNLNEMAASGAVSPPTTWDYIPIVLIQNLNEMAASGAVSPPTTWDYSLVVAVYQCGTDVAASAAVSAPVAWDYYV